MTNSIAKKIFASAVAVSSAFMGFAPIAAQAVSAGEVYKTTDGTVWFITSDMQRRPFTSGGAFLSYGFLSWAQVQNATSEVEALTAGSFIAPQDGKIFCATATKGTDVNGECSLVTGGMKAAFTSSAVFTGLGYSFARAQYGDSSFLTKTANLDNAGAAHSAGVLVNIDGTVYLVGSTSLMGIPSVSVFESWGYSFADVVTANSADRSMTKSGIMASRTPGHLSPSTTSDSNDDDGSPISGGAGDITITALSTFGDEEVGEDEEDVMVAAFDIEADDNSDVEITSIKVELAQQTGADSVDLLDYATEVSVWMDGEEVGRADVDEFNENNDDYTKSISLDGAIIRAGEENTFELAVSALSNLDSGDIDTDDWQIGVSTIRFVDGEDITTTESLTLDIDDNAVDDTLEEEFDFASFAAATDVELVVALDEDQDEINDAHVIDVDTADDTDEVQILAFTIEADGDSDLNIEEIPVVIAAETSADGAIDESAVSSNAQLWYNDESVASDTIAAGGAVVFEDLDIDIEAGEEAAFIVTIDVQDTGGTLNDGDTFDAVVTTDDIVAEDEAGERVADGDASGTAVGEEHAVYAAGIMAVFVSSDAERTFTADAATEDDQGEFTIVFDVTAFDGDFYVDKSVADQDTIGDAGEGIEYNVTATGGAVPTESSALLEAEGTVTGDNTNVFKVEDGQTRTFTLTIVLTADTTPDDGSAQVILESINWGAATNDTNDNNYIFDLGDYKTPYLFLNGIA